MLILGTSRQDVDIRYARKIRDFFILNFKFFRTQNSFGATFCQKVANFNLLITHFHHMFLHNHDHMLLPLFDYMPNDHNTNL